MNFARVGLIAGIVAGVVTFFVVFLFPIAVIGGQFGQRLQEILTGSTQGAISLLILGFTVIITALFITALMSLMGWLFGSAVKVFFTKNQHFSSLQWCPVGKLSVEVCNTVMPKAVQVPLQWCPKV